MRQLVIGDIHGGYKALLQVLERCNYNPKNDQIIFLGDYVDGWSQSYEVIQKLIELQEESTHGNIHIIGNHDKWFTQWLDTGHHSWTHGSLNTAISYANHAEFQMEILKYKTKFADGSYGDAYDIDLYTGAVPKEHVKFLKSLHLNYWDKENKRFYTHAGFNRHVSVKRQSTDDIFYWDRDLIFDSAEYKFDPQPWRKPIRLADDIEEVYVGHTTTLHFDTTEPQFINPVIAMDTGCGFKGKLTVMDVDTKEYWQSDLLPDLYPNEEGRD